MNGVRPAAGGGPPAPAWAGREASAGAGTPDGVRPAAGGGPPAPAWAGRATSAGAGTPDGVRTPLVEVYSHEECSLCRTASQVLERLRGELGFRLVEHDITLDDRLHRAYFERVPVVVVDGEELFEFAVDEAVLRARLAAGPA